MNDTATYRIKIHGQVDEDDLNARSPFVMAVEQGSANTTRLAVRTDQSGLIGLLRFLHGHDFLLLSIEREP